MSLVGCSLYLSLHIQALFSAILILLQKLKEQIWNDWDDLGYVLRGYVDVEEGRRGTRRTRCFLSLNGLLKCRVDDSSRTPILVPFRSQFWGLFLQFSGVLKRNHSPDEHFMNHSLKKAA